LLPVGVVGVSGQSSGSKSTSATRLLLGLRPLSAGRLERKLAVSTGESMLCIIEYVSSLSESEEISCVLAGIVGSGCGAGTDGGAVPSGEGIVTGGLVLLAV
jgi:hypothetical protein